MPEAAHRDVSITVEGIMVLGFANTNGVAKCTFGIPKTDDSHNYELRYVTSTGSRVSKPITDRSSISLVGPGASTGVGKANGFNDVAIDWKNAFFHRDNSDFLFGFKFDKCLEVFNGKFEVKGCANGEFQNNTPGSARPREVAEKVRLVIQAAANQQVVFVHGGEMIVLTDKQNIEITNICTEKCIGRDDFQFYYSVFCVPEDKRLHAKRTGSPPTCPSEKERSPNLPCWLVVYDDPLPGPFEP